MKALIIACLLVLTAGYALAETPESVFRQAAQHEREGNIARSIDEFKRFLKEFPKHSQVYEARFRLAKNQDRIGMIDEAIKNLERVVRVETDRFKNRRDALYLLGKLLGTVEKYELAARFFETLLTEGAGLYEEEVLMRCGGYYAVQGKHDEAGTKFNILARRSNSKYAEPAARKLAMVWIEAGHLDLAVDAVSDLATRFPHNQQARWLMLQIADKFREQRKYDQAIAACEQLRTQFPKTSEGQGAGYVIALCQAERGQQAKAAATFEQISTLPENRKSGLAAEALMQAADLHYGPLSDVEKSMDLYQEAARLSRADNSERQGKILERSYFRLAEHYFGLKKWAVALEYYSLLRETGTDVNILPRILKCQGELGLDIDTAVQGEKEVAFIKKKIAENPGTLAAAEGEVFLADRTLQKMRGALGDYQPLIKQYQGVLDRYPPEILGQHHFESYVLTQLGRCHARVYRQALETGKGGDGWKKALEIFEKAETVDPKTPYLVEILENAALVADTAGQTAKAFDLYQRLYEIGETQIEKDKDDADARKRTTEYLRSMLSRADTGSSVDKAMTAARGIIQARGKESEAARHALLYLGDLQYMKKDFSAAAKTFNEFIRTYGPPLDAAGNVVGGAWKPRAFTDQVKQVYEAAIRIAHCWYMQGHTQNMIAAYQRIARNFPNGNKHAAEAEYWLAMELAKGEAGKTRANKRKLAERLWTRVVNSSMDLAAADLSSRYHPWVREEESHKYVKTAMTRSAELFSELGEHTMSARILEQFLRKFRARPPRPGAPLEKDNLHSMAHYALGREYAALSDMDGLVDHYTAYTRGMRGDQFRVSALQILGYQATMHDLHDAGIRAYSTILDEYGTNETDEFGDPVPVPTKKRVRRDGSGWNGIRMEPPADLDLGAVRYALGFIYWKLQDWPNCERILWPFIRSPELEENKVRAKGLFMVGRCYFKLHDYANGLDVMSRLVKFYPRFEAVDEAYIYAGRACEQQEEWGRIRELHANFKKYCPNSPRIAHMDLYLAIADLKGGRRAAGLTMIKSVTQSETFEDVKADAFFHLAEYELAKVRENKKLAFKYFEESVRLYPRARSCLGGAKTAVDLGKWERARILLAQALRDFPAANPQILKEARRLTPRVLKELAKKG